MTDAVAGTALFDAEDDDRSTTLILSDLHVPDGGGRFLWHSWADGHRHLYLHAADGSRVRQVTTGPWDVQDIVGFVGTGDGAQLLVMGSGDAGPLQMIEGETDQGVTILDIIEDSGAQEAGLLKDDIITFSRFLFTSDSSQKKD